MTNNIKLDLVGVGTSYGEYMLAKCSQDEIGVDPSWAHCFDSLGDSSFDNLGGAPWARQDWPLVPNSDIVAALTADWSITEIATSKSGKSSRSESLAIKSADSVPTKNLRIPTDNRTSKPSVSLTESELAAKLHNQPSTAAIRDSINAFAMIKAYRKMGHVLANSNPLESCSDASSFPMLNPVNYGFDSHKLDTSVYLSGVMGFDFVTIRELLATLRLIYCSTIGIEYDYTSNQDEQKWLQDRLETRKPHSNDTRRLILQKLIEAEGFEKFLDLKFVGAKRFGLDGGEALIPALELLAARGSSLGVTNIILGMAHRGRLNVLCQFMHKPKRDLFREFRGVAVKYADGLQYGSGDVKYHLGRSVDRFFGDRSTHVSLLPNPSHLEIVDPVVLGKARATQDHITGSGWDVGGSATMKQRSAVLPILIHGDASFSGQGVVAESLRLSAMRGYNTAGSIHIIINNQIGFTTDPSRLSEYPYPSDIAKVIESPVIHVNGDDPDAVIFAAETALEFRQRFNRPIVIDLVCYRRLGHNETDDPSFTQPLMYKNIKNHPSTLQIYANKLQSDGTVSESEIEQWRKAWRQHMDEELDLSTQGNPLKSPDWLEGNWSGLEYCDNSTNEAYRGNTAVSLHKLQQLGLKLTALPDSFHPHRAVVRFMADRRSSIESGDGINWATAEALAFASLLADGHNVRLAGQDCERGTFSQRHSVVHDQETGVLYTPLNNLGYNPYRYEVVNTMLSEEAVLGFEYGYSITSPSTLNLWEAQFGDFANGAQVIFDQFISAGEQKWLRMSGLVCLLPHGYEGQGPEHSSARLERYLQLCAEGNMQVANCTTPANYFHILRRQIMRDFRKPLILMTPKSLLRHKRCTSRLADLAEGTAFHRILLDSAESNKDSSSIQLVSDSNIRRVIMCSGKVYYDLYEERQRLGLNDIYLLRLEQLYPVPLLSMQSALKRFVNAQIFWCQEEPRNMGAWTFIEPHIEHALAAIGHTMSRPSYVGRPAAASTSTGWPSMHEQQVQALLKEALQ